MAYHLKDRSDMDYALRAKEWRNGFFWGWLAGMSGIVAYDLIQWLFV